MNVALCDTVDDSREWPLETTKFIVYGPVNGQYYFFVDGNYFVLKSRTSVIKTDDWTGQPILIRHNFWRLCVQPLSNISWKVMTYKYESNNHLLTQIALWYQLTSKFLSPQAMEIIRTSNDKLFQVSSVNSENKTIQGFLLRKVEGIQDGVFNALNMLFHLTM